MPALYCYSVNASTMAPAPTDAITLTGAANKIIQITRVGFSATASVGGNLDLNLIKRTSLNTGGTFTNPTPTKTDSLDNSSVAVLTQYSVNPSATGTGFNIRTQKLQFGTSSSSPGFVDFEFVSTEPYGIMLRGANELFAVNFGGATLLAGSSFSYFIEWMEF